jgi:hypothetical protein
VTVRCLRPGCERIWSRDPVLEVACPTCRAPVGARCKRPSEHRVFGGEPHAERDVVADRAGAYGPCPLGICGLENVAFSKALDAGQADLFAGPVG